MSNPLPAIRDILFAGVPAYEATQPVQYRGLTTGQPGSFDTPLPAGWVCVTHIPFAGGRFSDAWSGPVLEESEDGIRIEVWDAPMTFPKAHCVIRRSEVNLPGHYLSDVGI